MIYLELLSWLKIQNLINILILDMVFNLMRLKLSLSNGPWFGKNVIAFVVDNSSSEHADNILIQGYLNSW